MHFAPIQSILLQQDGTPGLYHQANFCICQHPSSPLPSSSHHPVLLSPLPTIALSSSPNISSLNSLLWDSVGSMHVVDFSLIAPSRSSAFCFISPPLSISFVYLRSALVYRPSLRRSGVHKDSLALGRETDRQRHRTGKTESLTFPYKGDHYLSVHALSLP